MTNIPNWLCNEEHYIPKKDSNSFVEKSLGSAMQVLSNFKRNNDNKKAKEANTSLRLLVMLLAIILTSLSRNFSFVIFMITFVIVRIAMLSGESIKRWLKTILPVILFSLLILLPSAFFGNPKTPLTILGKIFVCVSLVCIVNFTSSFNDITGSLKRFHIPDLFIFTIDIAIKYIYILGDVCVNMLSALKTRTIGKNKSKQTSMSAILGTVFIKAKSYADDTSKAMECRGFNGAYVVSKPKKRFVKYDLLTIFVCAMIIAVFVYLEVLV